MSLFQRRRSTAVRAVSVAAFFAAASGFFFFDSSGSSLPEPRRATALAAEPSASATLTAWPVGYCDKIFADTEPGESAPLVLRAARNEYESGQIALRVAEDVRVVSSTSSDLTNADGTATIPASALRLRLVDSIRVTKNTPGAEAIVVRKAPCDMPDILRDVPADGFDLNANETRALWTTLFVPKDAKSGDYKGVVTVEYVAKSDANAAPRTLAIPVELEVFAFELPETRNLYATNWFSLWNFANVHKVGYLSEEFWTILEKYFQNMRDHRQNVVMTPWTPGNGLVEATRKADGSFEFDFSNLERYLSLAEKCGIAERIELSHAGGIDRERHVVALSAVGVRDEATGETVSVPADEWLKPGLQALENWLVETNRIDRAAIHVADEPYRADMASWRETSRRIKEYAPKIKRIDAIESIFFGDDLEVWVPKLTHYDRWKDALRRDAGNAEIWYYVCCHPIGDKYPNRFMDIPGSRIRALHWLNYAENLTGYLHWGYNYWQGDPFGPPTETYGPGDTHVVYPGDGGPLDSVRWEIERESLEDFEYLKLLEQLTRRRIDAAKAAGANVRPFDANARSLEIAKSLIRAPGDVEIDPQKYVDARLTLAREIEAQNGKGPFLVARSFPADGSEIVYGPIEIEVFGLVDPETNVFANGAPIRVEANGTFQFSDADANKSHTLTIEARNGDQTTSTTRTFTVR